jgi:hypothetical protein
MQFKSNQPRHAAVAKKHKSAKDVARMGQAGVPLIADLLIPDNESEK